MPGRRSLIRHAFQMIGLAAACAAPAVAQPDVTHQEIQDTIQYTAVGTTRAYAWGSYTCNIGNQSLSWINGGTPALAMNAYRLHNGRMLQIGLGFAKHSCCVANGGGCGTCSTSGFGLRPGCRDIYGAGFNGGQGRLGPRSGINPFTRTFATIPSATGDSTFRRVQVKTPDLSPVTFANAQYFAEGVYVCSEETLATSMNNATYRRHTVANTGTNPTYNWTGVGTGQVGKGAIYAWKDHGLGANIPDPNMYIENVDVPGEGRFVIAGKVIAQGNGTWQYEYAVFNLNSHRSGGSFTIPLPANASVNNVFFHSPNYHSGEAYSNTAWTSQRTSQGITWNSPQSFAQNPNSNALRWGTMYNFAFTSDAPPAGALGEASLGLFRPGTPTSIQMPGVPVPCVSPTIDTQPQLTQGCPCSRIEMSVQAVTGGNTNFRWQRETFPGSGVFENVSDTSGNACGSGLVGTGTAVLSVTGLTAAEGGLYRCQITSPCGDVTTESALLDVCIGDFNCDGAAEGSDVEAFFIAWENGEPLADTDASGGIDGSDVQAFFIRWSNGC